MRKYTIISTINGQDPVAIGSWTSKEEAQKELEEFRKGGMHYDCFDEQYELKEYDEESNPTPNYIKSK